MHPSVLIFNSSPLTLVVILSKRFSGASTTTEEALPFTTFTSAESDKRIVLKLLTSLLSVRDGPSPSVHITLHRSNKKMIRRREIILMGVGMVEICFYGSKVCNLEEIEKISPGRGAFHSITNYCF
jgi:hypothetical protein